MHCLLCLKSESGGSRDLMCRVGFGVCANAVFNTWRKKWISTSQCMEFLTPQAVLLWSWFLVHAACHLSFQFSIFVQDFPLIEHLHLRLDSCSPARPSPLPPPARRACASPRQELSKAMTWRGYLWDALPILALLNLDLGQQRGVAVQVVVGLHLGDGHGHHHGDQDGNWTLGESGSGRVGDVEWGGDVGKGTLLCRRSSWSLTWCSVWIWLFWLCEFYSSEPHKKLIMWNNIFQNM